MVAFVTGATLFAASAAAMISRGAAARGFIQIVTAHFGDAEIFTVPSVVAADGAEGPARQRHHAKKLILASFGAKRAFGFGGQPVCVRLCDGFFFPVSTAANAGAAAEQASCDSLCPDAPTSLFYQSSASDRIEDAISASGQPYSALPVALRYRSTQDNTCACHRTAISELSPLRDGTLRKGDAVMTPRGFLVFRGAEQATHTRRDFASVSDAGLPKDQRGALQALERVSQAPQLGAPRSWVYAQGPAWTPAPARAWVASAATATRSANTLANINVIRFLDPPDPATN